MRKNEGAAKGHPFGGNDMSEDISEQAARWHARQDRDDMEWDGFTAWLEADPRHREAFDDIAMIDEHIGRHRDLLGAPPTIIGLQAAEGQESRRRRIAPWLVAAAAAVIVVVVGTTTLRQADPSAPPAEYRAGSATRVVDLGNGARVSLAPGSTLVAEEIGRGDLSLSGRATFAVRHDPDRQLLVRVEGYRIRDVGTRFDVVAGGGMVNVMVAQGRVAVKSPSGAEVELAAGRSLTGFADGRVTSFEAGPAGVVAWKAGPLAYDRVPLGIVAAEVARMSGSPVEIDPAIERRPFSGVLAPAAGDRMAKALAAVAGLELRRDRGTIHLADPARR